MQGDCDGRERGRVTESGGRSLTYSVIINIMASTVTENMQIRKKMEKFSEKMARKTKFSESEVEKLVHIYNRITVNVWVYILHDLSLQFITLRSQSSQQ